uniref:Uncharacterized protein n=1 Tax=Photinus pyralis TaxID=7054 RepID=A0A1Y1KMV1_PHOPY
MTVSIPPKCDVSKTDTNDNETCCTNKNDTSTDHTGSLLSTCDDDENVNDPILEESESKCKKEICEHHKPNGEMRLYSLKDAPEYLQHNVFILTGYRGILNTKLCIESIFWWTNETINIWSHLFGWLLFVGLTIYDLSLLNLHASFLDKLCVAMLLICFQVSIATSRMQGTPACFRFAWVSQLCTIHFPVVLRTTVITIYHLICSELLSLYLLFTCLEFTTLFGATKRC